MIMASLDQLLNTVAPFVTPDPNLWWLSAITFPLILAALLLTSKKSRQLCSDFGANFVFGSTALAVLLAFVGPFLAVALVIIGMMNQMIGLSLNLSLAGFFSMILILIKLIPFLVVIWLLTKIPGIKDIFERWIGLGQTIAGKIWGFRREAQKKPNRLLALLGALIPALLVNSNFATHLTDAVVPGVIPGVVAAFGLGLLMYRTVFGEKIKLPIAEVKQAAKPRHTDSEIAEAMREIEEYLAKGDFDEKLLAKAEPEEAAQVEAEAEAEIEAEAEAEAQAAK